MKTSDTASDKPMRAFSSRNALGLLFMAGGLTLQVFWPRHSLQYGLSFGLALVGFALWPAGKYVYIPVLLSTFAVLLSLGKNGLQPLSLVLMALAALIGFYGWRETKKSKAADERSA